MIKEFQMKTNTKTNALRLAETAGLFFTAYEYDISDGRIDAVSIAEKIGRPADGVFKTLVTQAPGREYFVFIVPAASELDLKKAAKVSGKKSIELIPMKELLPLTGYVHGGCSPLGMKKLFPAFIDETAVLFDTICVSGGRVGLNIAVDPEALASVINAKFADITR
ncbi:MAG: Cys-tRNA(Pro) deacylase [Lentisphaerae bacterium]|nr:Cys-tRNA(Pro) deacylase [Lentisphaerota bacterium]